MGLQCLLKPCGWTPFLMPAVSRSRKGCESRDVRGDHYDQGMDHRMRALERAAVGDPVLQDQHVRTLLRGGRLHEFVLALGGDRKRVLRLLGARRLPTGLGPLCTDARRELARRKEEEALAAEVKRLTTRIRRDRSDRALWWATRTAIEAWERTEKNYSLGRGFVVPPAIDEVPRTIERARRMATRNAEPALAGWKGDASPRGTRRDSTWIFAACLVLAWPTGEAVAWAPLVRFRPAMGRTRSELKQISKAVGRARGACLPGCGGPDARRLASELQGLVL